MKRVFLPLFLVALTLVSCRDYSNRVYHYGEEIPLNPFILKVSKTDYRLDQDNGLLKIYIQIRNKSESINSVKKSRFVLRTEKNEIQHQEDLREQAGLETISFGPNEVAVMTIQFIVPPDELNQRLDLIIDDSGKQNGKPLSLVYLKNRSFPKNSEWQTTESPRWD